MQLTAELIESLSGVYLSPRYDQPQPTPEFHRECWRRYCAPTLAAATAAPRNHAKSTALTHDFILANVLFRTEDYVILVGSSEEMAIEHLNDIANELRDNEPLREHFLIKGFVQDQKTDIIVECTDGHQFRIIARGAEQKIRGRKWNGKRPGLIVGDDLEDDEQVENRDRRKKFRRWFFRACKQALRDGGRIRVHGTILHDDSLLHHLIKNRSWNSRVYKAHRSFDDFSQILWIEKFPEARLRAIRQEFIDEGDSAGYSQEYLNDPADNDDVYLSKDQFIEMSEADYESPKLFNSGVDFAISKQDAANRTSITVGGEDINNRLHFVDQRCGRMDSLEIIEELFSVQSAWDIQQFFVEDGQIWLALWPVIEREMTKRGIFMAFVPIKSIKDKATRGRSWQKRMKARACRFDKKASWYPAYEEECLKFTGVAEATLDDQFDSGAILVRGLDINTQEKDEDDFKDEEEEQFELESLARRASGSDGRSRTTGY